MPVLTTLRQSPTYLYVKVYVVCALVTLFQAAPVTSRIPRIGQKLNSVSTESYARGSDHVSFR